MADAWNQFVKDDPYDALLQVDDEGHGRLLVVPRNERLPLELGFELGEALYQLRAALDSCVYDAAIFETGKQPPPNGKNLEFPICESAASFSNASWHIRPLPDDYHTFIEAMQPYKAPQLAAKLQGYNINLNLGILNDWARKDRHRSLHIARSWASDRDPLFALPEGTLMTDLTVQPDGHLESESVVATFHLLGWRPGLNIHSNPNLHIEISIDEPPAMRYPQDTLAARTGQMIESVRLVVKKFEAIALGN